jgi:hypothetical protein
MRHEDERMTAAARRNPCARQSAQDAVAISAQKPNPRRVRTRQKMEEKI